MKTILLILFFLINSVIISYAQNGVVFCDINLEDALNKAKTEDKLVFIDCYTEWCGPCKRMVKEIFPLKEMGDYFNSRFICVKYDMEKGDGPKMAIEYKVNAYPTFIVIRPDGKVLNKLTGSSETASEFIDRVKESFKEDKALGSFEDKYKAGERGKEFLVNYLEKLKAIHDTSFYQIAEVLANQLDEKEKISEKYWFIYDKLSDIGSANENYLLDHRKQFDNVIGKSIVDLSLKDKYLHYFVMALRDIDGVDIKDLLIINDRIDRLNLTDQAVLKLYAATVLAVKNKDAEAFLAGFKKQASKMERLDLERFIYITTGTIDNIADMDIKKRWLEAIPDNKLKKSMETVIIR